MPRIRLIALVSLLCMLIAALPVQAQTPTPTLPELTEMYIADEGWSFNYPSDWIFSNTGSAVILASTQLALKHAASGITSGDFLLVVSAGQGFLNLNTSFDKDATSPVDALGNMLQTQGISDVGRLSAGDIQSLQIGDSQAAEVRLTVRRQDYEFLFLLVHYAPDFWGLFSGIALSTELDDQKPTIYAIAASLDINGLGGKVTYSTIKPKATFQYPDGWYVQAAGPDGAYMATKQNLLFQMTKVNYQTGDERIFVRINTAEALITLSGAALEGDASPLKFLEAEIKRAQGTTDTHLANVRDIDTAPIDNKPAAKVIIRDDVNSYAEEIWYVEYTPGVMVKLELTTAPDGLSQGETDAHSILASIQYDESSS